MEVDDNHSALVSTNLNPEDAVLVDNDEETLNLDASQHDIDENYRQQEDLQIQMQLDQPSLDPEGEEDYEVGTSKWRWNDETGGTEVTKVVALATTNNCTNTSIGKFRTTHH